MEKKALMLLMGFTFALPMVLSIIAAEIRSEQALRHREARVQRPSTRITL